MKWFFEYSQGISYIVDNERLKINVSSVDQSTINQLINAHNKDISTNGQLQDSDLPHNPSDVT